MRLNDIVLVQLRWFNIRRPNVVKNKTLTSTGKHRLRQSTLEGDDDRRGTHKSTDCVNEQ